MCKPKCSHCLPIQLLSIITDRNSFRIKKMGNEGHNISACLSVSSSVLPSVNHGISCVLTCRNDRRHMKQRTPTVV